MNIDIKTEEINQRDSNGLKQGLWRHWYANGQLWLELNYVNGMFHDLCRYWNSNGKLTWDYYYVNTNQEGEQIEYGYED